MQTMFLIADIHGNFSGFYSFIYSGGNSHLIILFPIKKTFSSMTANYSELTDRFN